MAHRPKIFIDGEHGTTGLGIRDRLTAHEGVQLRSIEYDKRRDAGARRAMMEEVDLVILCLPDDAAKESAGLAAALGNAAPKVLDASTAYRVDPDWVYGFPEFLSRQDARIAQAERVSNPGCYPTGAIGLIRPLVDAGLLPADYPVTINAVSGYTGGGKAMINDHTTTGGPAFELYGLGLTHKHVPETQLYGGLTRRPIFVPSVGHYAQGMLVSIPLHLDTLPGKPTGENLRAALEAHFAGCQYVKVVDPASGGRIEPEDLNNTNMLELSVYAHEKNRQAVLVARLDNLGKGASGAAVQNLELMLGLTSPKETANG